jgi:hypothetical protein
MAETFTIEFPPDVQESEVANIENELKSVAGVEDAGSMGARSIDVQTLALWVSVATGVVGFAKTAMPLIQSVIEMIRGKGIKGAKITLANGTSFSADEISLKDLENLVKASNA